MGRETQLILFFAFTWILTVIFVLTAGIFYKNREDKKSSYKGLSFILILAFAYPCIIGLLTLMSIGIIDIGI